MNEHSSDARRSINWVALLSSAIAAFSAATITILLMGSRATPPALILAAIAMLAALTWLAVRLRFPFLIVVAAIAAGYSSVREFAAVGVIVCSHSLLARTRFFTHRNGEWSKGFAGAASGWLAALSLFLSWCAHFNRGNGPYIWCIPLATFSVAMSFAISGGMKARRTIGKATDRTPDEGSFIASLFVGAASFVVGIVVVFIVLVGGIGNSGSSSPGAWQSKPQLQQQPSAQPPP